jgi:hypothetical protein
MFRLFTLDPSIMQGERLFYFPSGIRFWALNRSGAM